MILKLWPEHLWGLVRHADPGATSIPHESETLWMDPALGAVTSPGDSDTGSKIRSAGVR